ncbi:MAG: transcriptional repressor [Deltaproteobacteria bacterium]|nr:transcriptional repressor [Deltaproteobacteria bacterium]
MGDEIKTFRSFISNNGLRNTPEREEIIREIFSRPDHFDVDELYLRIRKRGGRVSKASIYRNIPLIMESDLIREVWYEDGHMHYEPIITRDEHAHLRCKGCGKVIEFRAKELKKLEQRLRRTYHFDIVDLSLDVRGYCRECNREKRDP